VRIRLVWSFVSPEARRARNALWAAFVVMGVGAMS
jgi:hypothetical protein